MKLTKSSFDRTVGGLLDSLTINETLWFISISGHMMKVILCQNYLCNVAKIFKVLNK